MTRMRVLAEEVQEGEPRRWFPSDRAAGDYLRSATEEEWIQGRHTRTREAHGITHWTHAVVDRPAAPPQPTCAMCMRPKLLDGQCGGVEVCDEGRGCERIYFDRIRAAASQPVASTGEAVDDDVPMLADDLADVGAGTWRVDERPACGCDRGADPCGYEDHDLLIPDRVICDVPIGGLVPMDDIRDQPEFAASVVRVINAAPALLAETLAQRTTLAARDARIAELERRLADVAHAIDDEEMAGCPEHGGYSDPVSAGRDCEDCAEVTRMWARLKTAAAMKEG